MLIPRFVAHRGPLPLALLAALTLVAGCASTAQGRTSVQTQATLTSPTATPAPSPITAFTCAAGGLPVRQGYTQASCSAQTQGGATVIHARFTASNTPGTGLDEGWLGADGWVQLDAAHGDGAVTSSGYGLYVNQAAWLVYDWTASSDNSGSITFVISVPQQPAYAPCGVTLAASGQTRLSLPLSTNSYFSDTDGFAIVPTCQKDVERYFTTSVASAGESI